MWVNLSHKMLFQHIDGWNKYKWVKISIEYFICESGLKINDVSYLLSQNGKYWNFIPIIAFYSE